MKYKNKYNLCLDNKSRFQNITKKNPSATASLRGSIYEEKIINLIKEKSKVTKKTVTTQEAEKLIHEQHKNHDHPHDHDKEEVPKNSKKTVKSSKSSKKIRKK